MGTKTGTWTVYVSFEETDGQMTATARMQTDATTQWGAAGPVAWTGRGQWAWKSEDQRDWAQQWAAVRAIADLEWKLTNEVWKGWNEVWTEWTTSEAVADANAVSVPRTWGKTT